MSVHGRMEVTLKISELPTRKTVSNGWQEFQVEADGHLVTVIVRPKVWKKLTDAAQALPQWVAAITGKMGETTQDGFVLLEPAIQVFEKKSKELAAEART